MTVQYSSSDEDDLYDHGTPFQGRREGDPGVPVTPLCKPFFLRKQPTIFRGKNAMTVMFDTV